MNNKIVIIGCGNVGMSYAYALLNQRTNVNELVLIDINQERTIGEAMDLNHCLAFAPSKINIKAGDYQDCHDAKIIYLAAGVNQKPGESRTDLIKKNSEIFKTIIEKVMVTGFDGIFLVATNPLDTMTYITYKYSKLKPNQVIGTGTSLDTARLRYLVGSKLNINPKNIHGYVIGEHGDSEFVPYSSMTVGSQNISNFLNQEELETISTDVRNAAYEIINRKGATYYGIGMASVRITNAILSDENTIITVSAYDTVNDIYIGLPHVIGSSGIIKKIEIDLNDEETNKLQNSIKVIKATIQSLEE